MAVGTRERIMDEALKLFAAHGLAGTAVTAIEQAAGLASGSGSFYRHFRSKQQVFEAAVERELMRLRQIRPARLPRPPDDAESLARRIDADLAYLREVRTLIAILIREGAASPAARRVREELVDAGLAGAALDLPGRARSDPAAAAAVQMCAVIGYFLTAEFFGAPPGDIDADRFGNALASVLVGALSGT